MMPRSTEHNTKGQRREIKPTNTTGHSHTVVQAGHHSNHDCVRARRGELMGTASCLYNLGWPLASFTLILRPAKTEKCTQSKILAFRSLKYEAAGWKT